MEKAIEQASFPLRSPRGAGVGDLVCCMLRVVCCIQCRAIRRRRSGPRQAGTFRLETLVSYLEGVWTRVLGHACMCGCVYLLSAFISEAEVCTDVCVRVRVRLCKCLCLKQLKC